MELMSDQTEENTVPLICAYCGEAIEGETVTIGGRAGQPPKLYHPEHWPLAKAELTP
jgi:hypothetical protein